MSRDDAWTCASWNIMDISHLIIIILNICKVLKEYTCNVLDVTIKHFYIYLQTTRLPCTKSDVMAWKRIASPLRRDRWIPVTNGQLWWPLKLCLSELLPVITYIVNLSLSTSTVPYELKPALITPLLKKVLLDPEALKNFRPVSNLTYLSKIIERVVVVMLNQHLTKNGLHEGLQSAYKQNHSTETALLNVQNDLLMAIHTCIWRSRPHPASFICCIWYHRSYYTAATTAWVGNQRCCIRLVQILFEPAQTIRCYQWHTIITSKSVFRSASGISTWPNTIHPVHNTTGRNSTEISAKFPSLCWWHTAVHVIQAE